MNETIVLHILNRQLEALKTAVDELDISGVYDVSEITAALWDLHDALETVQEKYGNDLP